ncbi:hypothetical protein DPMN_183420 [Dreissena polymorpha]|uniref:Uncharacterized protein n=1 Tax=Dreissena polymorpha TaxID=45954 RepID=A0A9D4I3K2_DREPO|nr:hypothetical protein DPMN_183420 [Dreissena polymorpha]
MKFQHSTIVTLTCIQLYCSGDIITICAFLDRISHEQQVHYTPAARNGGEGQTQKANTLTQLSNLNRADASACVDTRGHSHVTDRLTVQRPFACKLDASSTQP